MRAYRAVCIFSIICCTSACATSPAVKLREPDTSTAGLLSQAAEQMADDLDLNVGLAGKMIRLSENNFLERVSEINLPFSAVLRDAMATALSNRGATLTLQKTDAEAWSLKGTYGTEGPDLVITIKAEREVTGHNVFKTAVAARGKVSMSTLDPQWFTPDFSRVARTLMRQLNLNYHGADELEVTISPLKPGKGQPSLRLGLEFQKFLKTAVADSWNVEEAAMGGSGFGDKMEGTYTKVGNQMRFHVAVVDASGGTLTSAVFDVDINDIPSDLLVLFAPDPIDVCVMYAPATRKDLSAESGAASILLENICDAFVVYNLKGRVCTAGETADVRVEAKIKVLEESTRDGFRIAYVNVQIKLMRNKQVLGTVTRKNKKFFRNSLEDAQERVVQQMFQEKQIGKQLAVMILRR